VCWHISGLVTADLKTTVVHSYNLLINDVKTRSLIQSMFQSRRRFDYCMIVN